MQDRVISLQSLQCKLYEIIQAEFTHLKRPSVEAHEAHWAKSSHDSLVLSSTLLIGKILLSRLGDTQKWECQLVKIKTTLISTKGPFVSILMYASDQVPAQSLEVCTHCIAG